MPQTGDSTAKVAIYYDGDCPFCSDYARYLRLGAAVGAPALVDLRTAPEARARLEAEGFDLDEGMVADIGGHRHGGAEALHALALLTTRSGLFNRATAALFASPTLARYAYPVLRAGRNTVLELLGRKPFRTDESGWQALFTLFSMVFGFFAIMHFFIYAFRYTRFDIEPTSYGVLLLGAAVYLNPGSRRLFTLLLGFMAVDAWLQAPLNSNHTIIKNFLLLAFLGAGAWHLWKRSAWSDYFRDVVPVGRVLLLVMYFYGVFHKINEGFLDPAVSCAVTLWRVMPWPINLLDFPLIHYATIYGTFVVEGVIVVMLLVPRWRRWGIVCGIGFHTLLALSGFAMYPTFSTLAIALHVLFLSQDRARRIVEGENFVTLVRRMRSWQGWLLLPLCGVLIMLFAIQRDFNMVAAVWLILATPIFIAILTPGKPVVPPREPHTASEDGLLLWSRLTWLNLVGVLFFLNCAMPYFGLKTAQAMNMFANLRLEGGINNHLIMRGAPAPFTYLDDIVHLREPDGTPLIHERTGSEIALVYYSLLDRLDRNPEASFSYVREGALHLEQTAEDLADEIAETLHPRWFRKWFHFHIILTENPPPCR